MRTIRSYLTSEQARREEAGDEGFSLIELIVVVVILGVLAAIAIPIFLNLQGQAEQSAQDSVAANAATQVASNLAQPGTAADANLESLEQGKYDITVTPTTGAKIDNFYVTVEKKTDKLAEPSTAGPGKPAAGGGEEEEEDQ